ncbi:MAG TPA: hypothetical protein DCY20_10015 [Firmicutes bacterium]|nr:hypothetical protein [Bacillota bacterium]
MAKKRGKRKTKRRGKKQNKLKQYLMIAIFLILLVGVLERKYIAFQMERYDVKTLDKEQLNLDFIIGTVDEVGGDSMQLNWQEVTALVAVNKYNQISTISRWDIQKVANRFIKGNNVLSFSSVVNGYGYTLEQKKLAYQYLSELKNYGYIPQKLQSDSKEMQFINEIKEVAIDHYDAYGILPSITIAQAIIESHWGNSELALIANNLFGIKASGNWDGASVVYETREYYDELVTDAFRQYDDVQQSIADHANFLMSNPRYAQFFEQETYVNQALALQEAGYSTATDKLGNKIYAQKLIQIIQQYNLQLIDHVVKHD